MRLAHRALLKHLEAIPVEKGLCATGGTAVIAPILLGLIHDPLSVALSVDLCGQVPDGGYSEVLLPTTKAQRIDSDCIFDPDAIRELTACFAEPRIGSVGGRVGVRNPNDSVRHRYSDGGLLLCVRDS